MNKLFAMTLAVLALPFAALATPEIGAKAPNFNTVDTNGKAVNLADMQDDTVVLEWTNHECPFVQKFYSEGDMQKLQKTYTDKGVKWVRVISSAPDKQGNVTAEKANEIAAEQNVAATHTIRDESGEIGKLYDAKTTPHLFVIHKGNLAYMGAVDDMRSPKQSDIAGATPLLANALDNILDGKPVEVAISQPYGCSVKY